MHLGLLRSFKAYGTCQQFRVPSQGQFPGPRLHGLAVYAIELRIFGTRDADSPSGSRTEGVWDCRAYLNNS